MFKNRELLHNEEEFLKLNSEIDLRTKDLMEQLNLVMKQQEADQEELNGKWNLPKKREDEESKSSNISESEIEMTYKKLFGREADEERDLPQIRSRENESETSEGKKDGQLEIFEDRISEFLDIGNETQIDGDRNDRNSKLCHSANLSTTNIGQGLVFPGKLTRHKSESKLKDKALDGVLPESMKGMGQENVIRFLKAKVKVLTEQLEIVHGDVRKHVDKVKELQVDRERVAEDRDKWIQQANIAKNILVKHEQHASNIVVQLQNVQAENGHLKREVEKLKKELKQVTQNSGSNEVRLNRSIEEVEKLKASLRQAKQDEKDLRETHRKKTEELSGAVKRLDKQRIELLHAFKKQLVIIDNLKKQKGLIEAGKFVKTVEDDFMEFLDWNPGNT